ncbi:unnamed protein product [Lupinus luteus]|uniref:RRM domain-containing protein n=1 Tax=Lupinus luteus TaxID=3873 RepID=A0AAV1VSN4_LUPLU
MRERERVERQRDRAQGTWVNSSPRITHERPLFRNSITFFFTNFPPNHGAKDLWEIFSKWGKVVDVVIPPRVDKYGKKFGFVRFQHVANNKELVQKLDKICIGLYKIWVNFPKFQRRQDSGRLQTTPRREDAEGNHRRLPTNYRDGRNFADVVKAGSSKSQPINSQLSVPDLVFQTSEECPLWLRYSYFGILSDQVDCTILKEKLHLDGFYSIHVFSLGGRSVLLRAEEEGEIESLLRDEKEWFSTHFSSIHRWKPTDVAQDRFLWIRCYGIPLHAWEEDFFKKLGSLFGKFIGIDDRTRYKRSLEFCRLLISTNSRALVDKKLQIQINGLRKTMGTLFGLLGIDTNGHIGLGRCTEFNELDSPVSNGHMKHLLGTEIVSVNDSVSGVLIDINAFNGDNGMANLLPYDSPLSSSLPEPLPSLIIPQPNNSLLAQSNPSQPTFIPPTKPDTIKAQLPAPPSPTQLNPTQLKPAPLSPAQSNPTHPIPVSHTPSQSNLSQPNHTQIQPILTQTPNHPSKPIHSISPFPTLTAPASTLSVQQQIQPLISFPLPNLQPQPPHILKSLKKKPGRPPKHHKPPIAPSVQPHLLAPSPIPPDLVDSTHKKELKLWIDLEGPSSVSHFSKIPSGPLSKSGSNLARAKETWNLGQNLGVVESVNEEENILNLLGLDSLDGKMEKSLDQGLDNISLNEACQVENGKLSP